LQVLHHILVVGSKVKLCYSAFKSTIKDTIMVISANEVKIKGVSIFENLLNKFDELIINVRGKDKYVVIDIERYKKFRESELDIAYLKAMQDVKTGNYKSQTASEHIKELMDEL